ncbi:hypothetical protein ABTY53_01160 [Streptomyces noursei]|uniref:hypothetical protein n=1 Tax=Streptomyces noursei TaxID=1971 RepID=UPI0033328909
MNPHFRVATAIASIALLPLLTATTASAAESTAGAKNSVLSSFSCPNDGYITNWDVCTTLSNGSLLLHETGNGSYIGVDYYKSAGANISCKLGYMRSGVVHWSGAKTCSTSVNATATWTPGASCNPDVGLLLAGGGQFQTPPTRKC